MRQGGEDEDVRKSARTLLQCTIHWDEQSTTHTRELIRVIIRDPLLLSLNLDSTHTHTRKAKQSVCLPVAVKHVLQAQINHNGVAPFPTPHYAGHTYGHTSSALSRLVLHSPNHLHHAKRTKPIVIYDERRAGITSPGLSLSSSSSSGSKQEARVIVPPDRINFAWTRTHLFPNCMLGSVSIIVSL